MLTTGAWTYAVCKVNKPYPKKVQFGFDAIPPYPPPPTKSRNQTKARPLAQGTVEIPIDE